MANKKALEQHLAEYEKMAKKYQESRQVLDQKHTELEAKLADLQEQLHQCQIENPHDLSEESLTKDAELRKEIAHTQLMLTSVKERRHKLTFPPDIAQKREEIFRLVTEEAAQEYDDRLPGLLEEISALKKQYLSKLVEYHDLKHGVYEKIKQTCDRVGKTNVETKDFPRLREIGWHHRQALSSDGVKYTVSDWDVTQALEHGKINM